MNGKMLFLLLLVGVLGQAPRLNAEALSGFFPPSSIESSSFRYSHDEIRGQMRDMETTIPLVLNASIEKRIKGLATRGRKGMEYFLGRSAQYFPIFEDQLKESGLPEELKFLAVVESALKPGVVSEKGAAGLWQLMPGTAREYGLTVNGQIDERLDTNKSTEAATRFLSDLYQRFGDWRLAIAAYNCGPVRVRQAIKRRKSNNYSKIENLLPRQTRKYVEKFTAIAYLMNYYHFYNLRPRYPDYNLLMTQTILICKERTFRQISENSGIPISVLEQLNPSYKTRLIPANQTGNYLVLPKVGVLPGFLPQTAEELLGKL